MFCSDEGACVRFGEADALAAFADAVAHARAAHCYRTDPGHEEL